MQVSRELFYTLVFAVVVLLMAAVVVRYFLTYFREMQRVKQEISRAANWNDFVYWKRELFALRLSVILGITPARVKAVRRILFRENLDTSTESKDDGLGFVLMPSVMAILLCAVCLAGSTVAWYTSTKTIPNQVIEPGTFTVEATVMQGNAEVMAKNGTYSLVAGQIYTVTLRTNGNTTSGYCVIALTNLYARTAVREEFFTRQLEPDGSYQFTLTADVDLLMTVKSSWGTSYKHDRPDIACGEARFVFGAACICKSRCEPGTESSCIVCASGLGKCDIQVPQMPTVPDDTVPGTTAPATGATIPTTEPTVSITMPTVPSTEPTGTTVSTQPPATEPVIPSESFIYTVQKGDTLSEIAKRFGRDMYVIADINHITDLTHIEVGRELYIPALP